MTPVDENIAAVRQQITIHAEEFGRDAAGIRLLGVSKTHPADEVERAHAAGLREFGENYLQEALDKHRAVEHLDVRWHFIGQVQSNKTRELATHFDWVQTVDRERIAKRLSDQRPEDMPPLDICLQVNLDDEPQKGGVAPDDLARLADAASRLPRLRLRGLMAIPAPRDDFMEQRAAFARLRMLYEQLRERGHSLDTLSMGMSGDMRAAIAEGSTMLRIGTAIFGARQTRRG